MTGFKLTNGKGFHFTFENGWTVSIQIGGGNYCDNYDAPIVDRERDQKYGKYESKTAEIAAWDANKVWHKFEDDKVKGYVEPTEVLEFMNMIAAKQPTEEAAK
jgi:hypothetical protein